MSESFVGWFALAEQVWHKPLPFGAAALLLVNNDVMPQDVSVDLALLNVSCEVPTTTVTRASLARRRVAGDDNNASFANLCGVRDIWAHRDLGKVVGKAFVAKQLGPHASAFIVVNHSGSLGQRYRN
eukprot:SAG31_NODE_304_length_18019_cov_10.386440_12_plen_127_part_00